MGEEHIGSLVLIDCGESLGTYQGRISSVEPRMQTITLQNPLRNGVPYQVPKVTLKSEDIVDLKILQLAAEFDQAVNHVLTACRSGPKNETNGTNEDFPSLNSGRGAAFGHGDDNGDQKQVAYLGKTKVSTKLQQHFRVSPGDLLRGNDERKPLPKSSSPNYTRPRSRPTTEDHQPYRHAYDRDDSGRRHQQDGNLQKHRPLSDLCAPLDFDLMSTDFDFEENLAKFEKLPSHPEKAIAASSSTAKQTAALDRLLNSLDIAGTKVTPAATTVHSKNIRHDENIVNDPSRVYVNAKRSWRYMTEDNLEVQGCSAAQKRDFYDRALRKGYITQEGFSCAMADSAAQLFRHLIREKNIGPESVSFYMIFSGSDAIPKQIAKHLSRFFVNRGHSVTWILTGEAGQHDNELGVRIITDTFSVVSLSPSSRSFVFVIGRQGPLADSVSTWLLKNTFSTCLFVESDWRGVENLITDEDLLIRLGMEAGALIRLPSRVLLCWQLPCEEADSDLKSPVYICDTNLPSHFIESELPALAKDPRQKSKPYKFPFGHGTLVKLRKL